MTKVYSIIVTYNGVKWIEKCVSSLINSVQPTHVIVIDNGSTDDTAGIIQNRYPEVQLIETGKNLGYGQANNIGLKQAVKDDADYVFLLNQDAWVEPNTIETLIAAHKKNINLGIVSPVHLNGEGSKLDANFAEYFIQSNIIGFVNDKLLNANAGTNGIETNFVNAAAWLLPVDCIRKIGGFDPIFYHYGEDRNYTHRVLHAGYKIGICTEVFIRHDREGRIETPKSILTKDQINDLTHFCDIRTKGYKFTILKRLLRYAFMAILNAGKFDKTQLNYYLKMLLFLLKMSGKVGAARKNSLSSVGIPHLGLEDKF